MNFQTVAINKPDADTSPHGGGAVLSPSLPAAAPDAAQAATRAELALSVLDLSKSFRSGFLKRRQRGIEGVSFAVPRGSAFALLGHNGAGKTTTINCILDLVHPDGGEVQIMGVDHRRRESRARIGYLPERPYFFEHLTGRELLSFYADLLQLSRASRRTRIDEVLERTGMGQHASRRLGKYSKGMLQRIGLAQTLLGEPEILILDEPMSGLDPMGRKEVRELLLELKKSGTTIILSSHIVPDVEKIADSVGIIRGGHLVATHNLRDCAGVCNYQINLGCGRRQASEYLPAWAQERVRSLDNDHVSVAADDVKQLRELLGICDGRQVPVQSVDTLRTGLEDIFMTAHAGAQAEVSQ